jgi:hypothetical protein
MTARSFGAGIRPAPALIEPQRALGILDRKRDGGHARRLDQIPTRAGPAMP